MANMLDTDRKLRVDILCQFQLFGALLLKLLWQITQCLFSKQCDCEAACVPQVAQGNVIIFSSIQECILIVAI